MSVLATSALVRSRLALLASRADGDKPADEVDRRLMRYGSKTERSHRAEGVGVGNVEVESARAVACEELIASKACSC